MGRYDLSWFSEVGRGNTAKINVDRVGYDGPIKFTFFIGPTLLVLTQKEFKSRELILSVYIYNIHAKLVVVVPVARTSAHMVDFACYRRSRTATAMGAPTTEK